MSFLEGICQTQNIWKRYRNLVEDFVQRLVSYQEIAGIVILSGLSENGTRRFTDRFSDLDLAMVVSIPHLPESLLQLPFSLFSIGVQPYLPEWLPNFKFSVPRTVVREDELIDISINQFILEYEQQSHIPWDMGKLEAYAEAEIFFDRKGEVQRLVNNKIAAHKYLLRDLLITTLALAPARLTRDVENCIKRGLSSHAHEIMNGFLEDILASIYAANERFVPSRKWCLASLDILPWAPTGARKSFEEALLVHSHTKEDVERRRNVLFSLLESLESYCRTQLVGFPSDPYTYASTQIYPDRQLRHTTHADYQIFPVNHQSQKVKYEQWNQYNWSLGASIEEN